jgi:hypothetical protein
MPKYDGTGPVWGGGPGAGFGLGPCAAGRRGFGMNFGRGFGRLFGYSYKQPSKKEELSMVEADEKELEDELRALREYKKKLAKQ